MIKRVVVAVSAVACIYAAAPADASFFSLPRMLANHSERLAFEVPTLAPMAHARFCVQNPADCEVRQPSQREAISLTEARWSQLERVNREVNKTIAPQRNSGGVMTEEWVVSPKRGDCNDYAVTKRHRLLASGWPSDALILSEVVTTWGEHHLVLVVRAVEGDFVLDNLQAGIRPVGTTRYRWVRAQSPENPKFWSTIKIEAAVQMAMPLRPQYRRVALRQRTTLALRQGESDNCCGEDAGWAAEHPVVTEGNEEQ